MGTGGKGKKQGKGREENKLQVEEMGHIKYIKNILKGVQ